MHIKFCSAARRRFGPRSTVFSSFLSLSSLFPLTLFCCPVPLLYHTLYTSTMVKFSTAAAAASAVAFAGFASAQKIDTPTALYTCQPYQLAWSGGTAPYYVRVLVGGTTSDVLETLLTSTTETSYTWNVDQPAGTSITLGLTDSTGATAYSAAVSVSDGGDTSCVGAAASGSSAASSAAGSATLAASSASSGASSAAGTASSVASSVASRGSSVASSAASKASSAGGSATSAASSAAASATGDSSAGSLAVSGVLGVAALGAALFA